MDRVYQANASNVQTPAPVPGSSGFVQSEPPLPSFTPTTPGEFFYWWLTESIRVVIVAAGLTPDPQNLHQLADAVGILASGDRPPPPPPTPPPPPAPPGILDAYPVSVAFAFGRRRLFAGNSVALYRVRRSSDSAEADIIAATDGTDTAALTAFVGSSSAFLVKWYDQSGNGLHLVQATAAKQPKVVNVGTILANFTPDGATQGMASVGSVASHPGLTVYYSGNPQPILARAGTPIVFAVGGAKGALVTYAWREPALQPIVGSASGDSYDGGASDKARAFIVDTTGSGLAAQGVQIVNGVNPGYYRLVGATDTAPLDAGPVSFAMNASGLDNFSSSALRALVGYAVVHSSSTATAINAILS